MGRSKHAAHIYVIEDWVDSSAEIDILEKSKFLVLPGIKLQIVQDA